jgi:hypothetical protein
MVATDTIDRVYLPLPYKNASGARPKALNIQNMIVYT